MLIFVLIISLLIIFLSGYLVYVNYMDNLYFRGESFQESYAVKRVIDFILPKEEKAALMDNIVFHLDAKKSVRDLYLLKLICFVSAIIIAFAVVFTDYLNDKSKVFVEKRDLPFSISEDHYVQITSGLTFQKLDRVEDIDLMKSNIRYIDDGEIYLTVSSTLLYDTIYEMNKDLGKLFNFIDIITFLIIILIGWYIPSLIVRALNKMLLMSSEFEYAVLESFIYLNSELKTELLLTGLVRESVVYKQLFIVFLQRYREDNVASFDLVLKNSEFSKNFRTLIEYISLLESTDAGSVKQKILINQKNSFEMLVDSVKNSIINKRNAVYFLAYASIVVNLINIGYSIFSSIRRP